VTHSDGLTRHSSKPGSEKENAEEREHMEAVTEIERIVIERTPEDWLEFYLSLWVEWMRGDELPEGCPGEASGGFLPFLQLDFDSLCERMDSEHAELVNVAIWRLTPAERCALHRCYLCAVYHVRDYEAVLARAKVRLMKELKSMNLWFGE
jgi:hypothetical protein